MLAIPAGRSWLSGSAALSGSMTYYGWRAMLAIAARRLWRPLAVPLEQARSHGSRWLRRDGAENQRILKKKTPTG
jgi:hypothetical protein